MSDAEEESGWEEATRWFGVAAQDVKAARLCVDADEPLTGVAAYHCQQAAENLMKGLLVAGRQPLRRVHDLDTLAELVVPLYPEMATELDRCRPYSSWGTDFRYPGPDDLIDACPTQADVTQAIAVIERLYGKAIEVGS